MELGCAASWKDECLLRRPQKEDRPSRGEGDTQDRSRQDLRRGHLFGQALCGDPHREGRSLAPKKRSGSKPKLDESARTLLEADPKERPAATLSQRREFLRRVSGVEVSDSTLSRMLRRMGWTRKKIGACERERRVLEDGLACSRGRGDLRRAAGVRG
jgi:transposase